PNGKVLAVEASPKIVKYLKENMDLNNLNNVTVLEYAVTDKDDDEVNFYEPPSDHFGMGSIAPQFHSNPISVKTKTLDSIIKEEKISKVNVIKVDVEGYEALVFKGGEKLLTSLESPVIIFEFCDWAEERSGMKIGESQRILRDFGYKLWKLEDFMKVKRPLPLEDILESGAEMLVGVKGGINE
ncbi:MAG TPA: FkbM family methyltransferase, partial [Allocoleopsis sp.]